MFKFKVIVQYDLWKNTQLWPLKQGIKLYITIDYVSYIN